ncbi:AlpA family transcriptional regulator [Acinetobacter sp. 251-1]|uniref:helix-turn-helix transcriptional regulator n=1 Tax=Acinetobacter sp. 251-1 TaxID=2746720 RepID=UPI00257654F7|nr:AlpA family transcriptional regulator [Acinetobacter sp. 251-1]MDM1762179.1 AlpA family transcriptional regulator [Acinetobacter sp. 251-1]
MNTSKNQNNRLIRRKEVQKKTGLGASSIYAMMKSGEFPQCLNLSERRVAWVESDVDSWVEDRIAKHKAANAVTEA